MLINGIDISTYGATHLQHDIQTAEVITYQDWLRNAPNFIVTGQKETYKVITCEMGIKGVDDDDILQKIGNLIKQAEKCTIQFDDTVFLYDAILKAKDHKMVGNSHKLYALHIEWQAAYAYKPAITETLDHVASKTITVLGNLPTPAIATITPSIDTISATLTGLSKNPIIINNLHADNPITIDGEKCTVTEHDFDSTITMLAGDGKWNWRKYTMWNFANPDNANVPFAPKYSDIPVNSPYSQALIPDGADLVHNTGYDYLGHAKTAIYSSSPDNYKAISIYHDDGATVYFNGEIVYEHIGPSGPTPFRTLDTGPFGPSPSITLILNEGWNTLEILLIQHFGPDGIWGIQPVIGSVVEGLNCFYCKDANSSGIVNKFGDTDMWAFPTLQPGENAVGIDITTADVQITYKPKFI